MADEVSQSTVQSQSIKHLNSIMQAIIRAHEVMFTHYFVCTCTNSWYGLLMYLPHIEIISIHGK